MADVVEEVPAKEEEVESGDEDESDADSIPELEETEAGAGGREGSIPFASYHIRTVISYRNFAPLKARRAPRTPPQLLARTRVSRAGARRRQGRSWASLV